MDLAVVCVVLHFRNIVEEPSFPVEPKKGRCAGLGQDLKEKGVQTTVLLLMGVVQSFVLHIGKDIGLHFLPLHHPRHVGIVHVPSRRQQTVDLTPALILLFQQIFNLEHIVARPSHVHDRCPARVSDLIKKILPDMILILLITGAHFIPVFDHKAAYDLFILRGQVFFLTDTVIPEILLQSPDPGTVKQNSHLRFVQRVRLMMDNLKKIGVPVLPDNGLHHWNPGPEHIL